MQFIYATRRNSTRAADQSKRITRKTCTFTQAWCAFVTQRCLDKLLLLPEQVEKGRSQRECNKRSFSFNGYNRKKEVLTSSASAVTATAAEASLYICCITQKEKNVLISVIYSYTLCHHALLISRQQSKTVLRFFKITTTYKKYFKICYHILLNTS